MASQTFTTAGSFNFTVPADVYEIIIELWGAGAGGGGSATSNGFGGGGGGAGAYVRHFLAVTPGQVIAGFIGSHGVGGINAAGTNGTDSWFVNNTTVLAKAGMGGQRDLIFGFIPNYGAGGVLTACIGHFRHSGGDGGGNSSGANDLGGAGGGGSAGSDFDGNKGVHGVVNAGGEGGDGGTVGGFKGGKGGTKSNNGLVGTGIGAGGGGCGYSNTAQGGNGVDGQAVMTYTAQARSKKQGVSTIQGITTAQF